jgi:hypothetical protein
VLGDPIKAESWKPVLAGTPMIRVKSYQSLNSKAGLAVSVATFFAAYVLRSRASKSTTQRTAPAFALAIRILNSSPESLVLVLPPGIRSPHRASSFADQFRDRSDTHTGRHPCYPRPNRSGSHAALRETSSDVAVLNAIEYNSTRACFRFKSS